MEKNQTRADNKQSAETMNPHTTMNQSFSDFLKENGFDEQEDNEDDEIFLAGLLEFESPKRADIG